SVYLDLIYPLPRSQNGFTGILVVVDSFSKYTEIIPLRNGTSREIINKLRKDVLSRYGCMEFLTADNGSCFIANEFQEFCAKNKIILKYISPYHAQANMTERYNQTLEAKIRMFLDGNHTKWDEHLQDFALAFRSTINDTTGFSPAKLFFGRELRLPLDNALQITGEKSFKSFNEYIKHKSQQANMAQQTATKNIVRNQLKQQQHYNRSRRPGELKHNDLVLVRTHPISNAAKKFSKKLAPLFEGPYRILNKLSDITYEIGTVDGRFMGRQHISNLKKFIPRVPLDVSSQTNLRANSKPAEKHECEQESGQILTRPKRLPRVDYRKQLGHRMPNCFSSGGIV
ncbi:unnamed protein product, partial [Allacma fusca]